MIELAWFLVREAGRDTPATDVGLRFGSRRIVRERRSVERTISCDREVYATGTESPRHEGRSPSGRGDLPPMCRSPRIAATPRQT